MQWIVLYSTYRPIYQSDPDVSLSQVLMSQTDLQAKSSSKWPLELFRPHLVAPQRQAGSKTFTLALES